MAATRTAAFSSSSSTSEEAAKKLSQAIPSLALPKFPSSYRAPHKMQARCTWRMDRFPAAFSSSSNSISEEAAKKILKPILPPYVADHTSSAM
jgi:hypothetical protein